MVSLSPCPLVLLAFVVWLAGCLSAPPRNQSPDGLSCGQRLIGGSWRLTGFQPDQPLSPQDAASLERLHGSLRLSFDGQNAITTGPGLHHVGPYRVESDDGVSCRIVAPDDTGVVSETFIRFLGSPHRIEVIDRRSAIPGRSTMERGAPGT
ncbi:MAG: hypothetical protein RMJ98_08480 [Myxococcales bacterium]|nr:hypothetical protein [Polyangiaceae bacterium]MDW8249323.1 hypothetical protein [Myxococcales bacterium]